MNAVADIAGDLWHKRLSHISERGMHILFEKDPLLEVKGLHLEKCVDCLAHANLTILYWDEVMLMVVYLINSSPLVPPNGDVPQRVWTGRNISYQHMRMFRFLAYMHVAKDQRVWMGRNISYQHFRMFR